MGRLLALCLVAVAVAAAPAAAADRELKIAGGAPVADASQAPWAVLLQRLGANGTYRTYCTANVLNATTVVTAAHCLATGRRANAAQTYRIQAGAVREDAPGAQVVGGRRVTLHPYYRDFVRGYDVGMLELDAPLDLSTPAVQPIELAAARTTPRPGKRLRFFGWGVTETGAPQGLRSMDTTAILPALCAPGVPTVMCAFNPRQAPCGGDSGGGLVRETAGGRQELVGLDSYGAQECRAGQPDGFADLGQPALHDWVTTFLAGKAQLPAAAPRAVGRPRVVRVSRDTSRLRCRAPRWWKRPQVRTTWMYGPDVVIARTKRPFYVARKRDEGRTIFCISDATNRAGSASVRATVGYRFSFIPR